LSLKNVLTLAVLAACASSLHASTLDLNSADWSSPSSASPVTIAPNSNGLGFSYYIQSTSIYSGAAWTVSTTPSSTGTITFDWDNSGNYWHYQVTESLVLFAYNASGVEQFYTLSANGPENCCITPSGGFDYTGVDTVSVNAGEPWGFIISGSNYDSTDIMYGTLTISDASPTPEPASWLLLATGLAAIAAFWRFGKLHSARS
jgi:hypothetical protein